MKRCSVCKKTLPLTSFYLFKSGKHSSRCKPCNKIYRKEYYWKNKEKENVLSKTWYNNNREHKAQYYKDNIEHIIQYRIDNAEKISNRFRNYRIKNRDAFNRRGREWRARMWIEDPEYMIDMYEKLRTYTRPLHKEWLLDNLLDGLNDR